MKKEREISAKETKEINEKQMIILKKILKIVSEKSQTLMAIGFHIMLLIFQLKCKCSFRHPDQLQWIKI